jgi:hypothetical protein
MIKLSKFNVSLLRFAKPVMLFQDYEWAGAYIKDDQFIGQLVVTPSFYLPCAAGFDQFVRVRLKRPSSENAVPSLKQIHEAEVRKDPGEPWPSAHANSDIQHSMRYAN